MSIVVPLVVAVSSLVSGVRSNCILRNFTIQLPFPEQKKRKKQKKTKKKKIGQDEGRRLQGPNKQKTRKRTSGALRVQSHAWARQFNAPDHAPCARPCHACHFQMQ